MTSNSIIDVLNESIQNFKNLRSRNRSSRPSPTYYQRDYSSRKLNTSSSEQESRSLKNEFRMPNTQKSQIFQRENPEFSQKAANNTKESSIKAISSDSLIKSEVKSSKPRLIQEEYEANASFTLDQFEIPKHNQEIIDIFQEIAELKNGQQTLENQIKDLESKISENLNDMQQALTKSDFSSIITRIGSLQDKFANRSKLGLSTEKLSDLFEKISNLEFEAERIKRENTEVETLYHQSLNEIYEKIEKLKGENKALTDIILSSPASTSPKHSFQRGISKKNTSENLEKNLMSAEISLKKIIEEEKQEKNLLNEIYNEKEFLENEQERIKNEITEIPPNSKSMANKKKKQALENEFDNNQLRLEALNEKIENFKKN